MRALFLVPCVLAAIVAQGAEVRAWLEPEAVPAGQQFRLMIEATGSSVDDPVLPATPELTIDPRPRIRQDKWSMTFTKRAVTRIRGYVGQASKPGVYTIPPVQVNIDGAVRSTEPLQLTVTEGRGALPGAPDSGRRPVSGADTQGDRVIDPEKDCLRVEAIVDKTEAWLNEPVLLTLRRLELYHHSIQIRSGEEAEPTTEGFYVLPIEKQGRQSAPRVEEHDGLTYRVEEKHLLLFPTDTGELTIGPWPCAAKVAIPRNMMFYDERDVRLASDPLVVHVKPLPPAPPAFTGAVGQFEAVATFSHRQLMQGVPVPLEVRVTGRGNPNAVGFPRVIPPEGGSVADPVSNVRPISDPEFPAFEKVFTYGVTVSEPGPAVLPAFSFAYFDTDQGQYVTQELGPFEIEVIPAGDQQRVLVDANAQSAAAVEVLGSDIRPLVAEPGSLRPDRGMTPVHAAAVVAPPVLYGALVVFLSRRRRYAGDASLARARRARAHGLRKLRHVTGADDPPSALYEALGGYLADKLGVLPGAVTSQEVGALLRDCGVDDGTIEGAERILRACERARYAAAPLSGDETRALVDAAGKVIERVETLVRKGGVRS